LKKDSKSCQRSEANLKRTKVRGPVQRDAKEVMAEVLGKLRGKLDAPAVSTSAKEKHRGNTVGPDRLTVGVDLGDRWSQYCILGLAGETLAEGQLRTTQEDVREFFQALTGARVVVEVGTHFYLHPHGTDCDWGAHGESGGTATGRRAASPLRTTGGLRPSPP